jgi:hypothetical protein
MPAPAPEGMPFEIRAAANVDENLFMLHLLASYYEAMPGKEASAAQISAWLANTRAALGRARNALRNRRFGPRPRCASRGQPALFQHPRRLPVNLGAIEKQRSSQNATDVLARSQERAQCQVPRRRLRQLGGSRRQYRRLGFLTGIAEISQRQQQHNAEAAAGPRLNGGSRKTTDASVQYRFRNPTVPTLSSIADPWRIKVASLWQELGGGVPLCAFGAILRLNYTLFILACNSEERLNRWPSKLLHSGPIAPPPEPC